MYDKILDLPIVRAEIMKSLYFLIILSTLFSSKLLYAHDPHGYEMIGAALFVFYPLLIGLNILFLVIFIMGRNDPSKVYFIFFIIGILTFVLVNSLMAGMGLFDSFFGTDSRFRWPHPFFGTLYILDLSSLIFIYLLLYKRLKMKANQK